MISLTDVATLATHSPFVAGSFSVENIGGGVMAITNFDVTLTINGGQQVTDDDVDMPADVLICRDGYEIGHGRAISATHVLGLLVTATGSVAQRQSHQRAVLASSRPRTFPVPGGYGDLPMGD